MPLPLMAIGAGISGLSSIAKLLFGAKQQKMANRINPQWQEYSTSPYAQKQLGLASNLFNSRMAGAGNLERNIFTNQGNQLDFINKNATDASQALSFAAGAGGQTNQALSDLQTQEAQNKYAMLGNLNQAYQGMTNEGDKVHQNKLMKYQIDKGDQAALRESAWKNIFGAGNDLAGMFGTLGMGQQQNSFWSQFFGGGGNKMGSKVMGRNVSGFNFNR